MPKNLLVSIGLVESGRRGPQSIRAVPWPWTVNVDGAGHYFANEQDAAAFTRTAQAAGAKDTDVGCFQISLQNHPDAFVSLDAAFDPAANANFAAHFLNVLKVQTGSWAAAIANYHSALPELGLPYQRVVMAAWQRLGAAPDADAKLFFDPALTVMLEAPAARLVRVITLGSSSAPPGGARLPHVFTP